ncbi:MAG TPA: YihY/virulence factor BrkB family protein [Gemmatimonadaceae bacterium]|jgi:membrane protein|nr:YihY/virulence factor BrkB family protein [Gemmatimonadaceae bacterium]
METRTPTPEPLVEASAKRFIPPPAPTRSLFSRARWALRDYAKRVWDNSGEDNVLFLAGGIAFNILLAAVPFVLLLVWGIAQILHNRMEANRLVVQYLDRVLPSHVESPDAPTHKIIEDILTAHAQLGIFSALGFVWFSTRLFGSLRTVLASVFDIEQERGIIQGKIFDIKITILSTILITANTLISTYVLIATKTSRDVLVGLGIRQDVMGQASAWGTHLVGTALLGVMFFALYKFLPIRRVRTKTAWVAALFTSVMFELAKVVFNLYVSSFNPGSLYTGAAAAVVVVVIWVYYAALIFILGGEVGQVYELRRTRKRQREVFLD